MTARPFDELRARLSSDDVEERRRATSELVDVEVDHAADLVVLALGDDDWRVRKEAVLVAQARAPSRVMLGKLIGALSSVENVGLRNAAVEAIGGYGEDAVLDLAEALPTLSADGRKLVVEALGLGGSPSSVPLLESVLDDIDPNVRLASVEALASIGRAGVHEVDRVLAACLDSEDPLTTLAALEGLNGIGRTVSWPTVERCLSDSMLHDAAVRAAGHSGDAQAVPALLRFLVASSGVSLNQTALALSSLSRAPDALTELLKNRDQLPIEVGAKLSALVRDEQQAEEIRRAALRLLGILVPVGALDCALTALNDEGILSEAHQTLERLGGRAVPGLVEAAQNGPSAARGAALAILSRIAEPDTADAALGAAYSGLSDESAETQRAALGLIARIGKPESLAVVAHLLRDGGKSATVHAVESALRELALRHSEAARALACRAEPNGPDAHSACVILGVLGDGLRGSFGLDLAFLSAALSNTSPATRCAALEALSSTGADDAVTAIAFALTDEEPDVRRTAIAALGRIRGADQSPLGVSELVELVQHAPDSDLLAAAARALGDTGDVRALSVLKPLLKSSHPLVSVSGIEAISRIAGSRGIDLLLETITHPEAEVAKAAMLAVSDSLDPRVLAHLGACLDHEAWDVRRLAADLLGRLNGRLAVDLLRSRLQTESSPPVRDAICHALERSASDSGALADPQEGFGV